MLLAAVLFLTSCTGSVTSGETSGDAPETTVDPYRVDREVRDDYKSIEISGEHDIRIFFVNAGKADSILVEADGKHYLIDTGEKTSVPKISAALEYMEVERLSAVFLTHSHGDHIGGMPMLSQHWASDVCYTPAISGEMTKIQKAAASASLEPVLLDPGQVVELSEGLYFEVLGPIRFNPLDENDNSLVLRMTVNGKTVLFAADMQHEEEKTLMRAGFDLRCDILKVGNHGNKDATSTAFIEETSPDYAVITTDRKVDENSAHKSIRMENVAWGHVSDDVEFVSMSKEEQSAVIRNTGSEDLDLSYWFITSDRGGELFMFPEGAVLPAGGELVVAANDSKADADYKWGDAKVWNKNKDDKGTLIDRHGNVIDEMLSE